jgi:microsomal dipeptidase-like Zn-dependent dipeptidase
MDGKDLHIDSTTCLDNVYSLLYKNGMRIQDVAQALRQQWKDNEQELHRIRDEQNKLRAAHIRFLNLEEEAKRRMTTLQRVGALLTRQGVWSIETDGAKLGLDFDIFSDEISLWETLAEFLKLTGEIRVVDLHLALRELYDKNVTRQAIESAMRTHSDLFKFKRSGREVFVSLK